VSSAFELATAAQLLEKRRQAAAAGGRRPLVTHVAALDALQGGGLHRGSLIELHGSRSSGRLSIALAALTAATAAGEAAALIDCGDHLDPQAAQACGVELARLLWLRPRRLKDALSCAEMALAAGLALVALDLGERPARGSPFAAWLRLARAAKAQNAVLLLLAPRPTAGTAADVVVRALRARPVWNAEGSGQTPLLAGLDARLVVERHRGPAGAGGAVALPLRER